LKVIFIGHKKWIIQTQQGMNGLPENKTCVLEEIKMKYYVTLTGLNYRFGTQPFTVGQKVKLVKEPENDFDREAIRAELPGLGKVGYVANSTHTVLGDCYSAGRIYDKIGAAATAKVKYVLANAVVCSVKAADMGQAGLPPVDPATGLPFGNEEDAIAF
jgi:hypothetical protein